MVVRRSAPLPPAVLELLHDGELDTEGKLTLLNTLRAASPENGPLIDRFLLEDHARLRDGLEEAHEAQGELKALLERLTAPPWFTAVYLGTSPTSQGLRLRVLHGGSPRIVAAADGLDPAALAVGEEVLLNDGLNAVMGRSDGPPLGETAVFDRYTPDGRLVVRSRDEEVVVAPAAALGPEPLKTGDRVRWSRDARLVLERLGGSQFEGWLVEEDPRSTFDHLAGLDSQIAEVKRLLSLHHHHEKEARKYDLQPVGSLLLVGPPGVGKTAIARGVCAFLKSLSPEGRAFFIPINPGSLHSVWYSESETRYREVFRFARELSERNPGQHVVLFFDEVDAVAGARGQSLMRVDDRVLMAFSTELDGFRSRGKTLVIAATNRPDAIDPAMLRPGRLAGRILEIPRPDRRAAAAILARYLRADIPFARAGGGGDPQAIREEIIESAVSRIYSPNGDGDLAVITLADRRRRAVAAHDLTSGALISQIAADARELACAREVETGEEGVRLGDLLSACDRHFRAAARVLHRFNVRQYIAGLPQDVEVASVDPVERKVKEPHRYLAVP